MMTKGHFKEVHPLGRVPVYHGSRHVSHVGSRTRVSRYLGYRLGLGYWVLRSVRGKSYEYLFLRGIYSGTPGHPQHQYLYTGKYPGLQF